LPQSKLCNYSSANLSGSLVGEAKGLALHLSDDTGLTELLPIIPPKAQKCEKDNMLYSIFGSNPNNFF